MYTNRHWTRWTWPFLTLAVILGLVFAAPHWGFGRTPSAGPVWSERAIDVPKTTITAPDWVTLAKSLKPAVVNVAVRKVEQTPMPEYFRQFFGGEPRHEAHGLGSGFVIDPNGYVVTNNHVVEDATEITVRLADGRELPATILGRDPKTDLALLKVEATGLPTVPAGDSSGLQVGEPVMAIGNPFGLEQTVTTGIVSAMGRVIGQGPYDDFIQTDASINPGNSGGPLINARGQAVGINTAIFSRTGGSVGIGFAIPINLAKPVVTQLAEQGHVTRAWLGVSVQPLTPDLAKSFKAEGRTGVLVSDVIDGSPAAKAGLRRGDILLTYEGRPIARVDALPRAVADTPVGRAVTLTVLRDGAVLQIGATVAKLEEAVPTTPAAAAKGGSLGLSVQPLTPEIARQLGAPDLKGVFVRGVAEGGAGAKAGLRSGDVIVEVDKRPVQSVDDLRNAARARANGAPLLLRVHRDGTSLY
ncbi:MAG: Do family serine endopeptidase, partial [Candidatus Binatia bacterium]